MAISAGLSQYHGLNASGQTPSSDKSPQNLPSGASLEPAEGDKPPHLAAITDVEGTTEQDNSSPKPKPFPRCRLRLDAYLGEWLSPDYYEAITPPPGSILMIASAKAELLRRGEHLDTTEDTTAGKGHFPGGWSGNNKQDGDDISSSGFSPGRDRVRTIGSEGSSESKSPHSGQHTSSTLVPLGYTPPVPSFAVAPPDPIPAGFVAHARDACIEVDYQWDSTRPPQDWGDGGEYGEEWSAMHKRFRKGIGHMIKWYRLHRESAHQAGGHKRILHPHEEYDDENTDTVLILVTHGAGCNALIGALTNQPVLMDVGMASLTMAVRKEDASLNPTSPSLNGPYEPNLSNDYSVILTASTEHLRTGSSPMSVLPIQPFKYTPTFPHHSHTQSASPRIPPYRYRPGNTTFSSIGAAALLADSLSENPFTLPDSFSRFTVAGHGRSNSSATSRASSGLWSKPDSDSSPKLLPRQDEFPAGGGLSKDSDAGEEDSLPALGLWGTASGEVQEREKGFKRRWTVTDRGEINATTR